MAHLRGTRVPARGSGHGRRHSLHIYNVHLGTAVLERRYQATRLAAFVHDKRIEGPKVILGDFNEWMRGLATRTLSALFQSIDIYEHLKRRRTYPGIFPCCIWTTSITRDTSRSAVSSSSAPAKP